MSTKLTIAVFMLILVAVHSQQLTGYYCNISNCITCSDYNYCAQCEQGYLWSLDNEGQSYCSFVQCNIQFCEQCYKPNICEKCQDGYYISEGGKCMKGQSQYYCSYNCLNCTKTNTCNFCQYGYKLLGQSCVRDFPGYKYSCYALLLEDTCQVCSDGFIVRGYTSPSNNCERSPMQQISCNISNCYKCSSNNHCQTCLPGYTLNQSLCLQSEKCTDPYCLECSSSSVCKKCQNKFTLVNGKCEIERNACNIEHCLDCSYRVEACEICEKGYSLVPKMRYGFIKISSTNVCEKNVPEHPHCKIQGYQGIENGYYNYYGCIQCLAGYTNVYGDCIANITQSTHECNVTNCQYCAFPNYCTKCKSGFEQIRNLGLCWKTQSFVPNCQIDSLDYYYSSKNCRVCNDQFVKTSDGVCLNSNDFECPKGCKSCLTNNTCQSCRIGFSQNAGKCDPYCSILNCYECYNSTTCSICQLGYLPNNQSTFCTQSSVIPKGKCSQYNTHCIFCSIYSGQFCLECEEGYTLSVSGYCYTSYPNNITGCAIYSIFSGCQQCQPGFLLVNRNCYTLGCDIPNCSYCFRSSVCLVCSEGFTLNNQSICEKYSIDSQCKEKYCVRCSSSGECLKCYDGYKLYQGSCVCPFENCVKCLGNIMCLECVYDFFPTIVQDGGCAPIIEYQVLCQVDNCAQCFTKNKCAYCNIGYSIGSNGLCQKNPCKQTKCQLCFGQQQFCYLCKDGYMQPSVYSSVCIPAASDYSCAVNNCAYCSSFSTCYQCYDRYKLTSNNTCVLVECPKNCAYCLYQNQCVVCEQNYQLIKNLTCIQGSQYSNSGISTCPEINLCLQCSLTYYGRNECNVCIPGFQPSQDKLSCVPQKCQADHCQVCIPYGTTLSSQSSLCMICEQGYFLNSHLRCVQYPEKKTNITCDVHNCIHCPIKNNYCAQCIPGWSPILGRCYSYVQTNCKMIANCEVCMRGEQEVAHCYSCEENFYLSENSQCKAHRSMDMDESWRLMLSILVISSILTGVCVWLGLKKRNKISIKQLKESRQVELKNESKEGELRQEIM